MGRLGRIGSGLLSIAVQTGVCAITLGPWGTLLGLLITPIFGYAVMSGRMYRGVRLFLLDHTWSLLNTFAGSLFLALHVLSGHSYSVHPGHIHVQERTHHKYAMTIGPVIAGATPALQEHEEVHVRQARLLGPFYLPLVGLNYVVFAVLPIWLLYHDWERWPIRGPISYFTCGVYPHVFNEVWAYRACSEDPGSGARRRT